MSLDNGVYILCTKDQYRVLETTNIEELYYNSKTQLYDNKLQEDQLYKYFAECKYTYNYIKALLIAHKIYNDLVNKKGCEYGIKEIHYNDLWAKIDKGGKT